MSLELTPAEVDLVPPPPPGTPALGTGTLYVMAAACGTAAANIFYNQPLLGDFANTFGVGPGRAGIVATAAQVGYGIGLLLFVPLGDLFERRRVALALTYTCAVLLIATPSLATLVLAQTLVGITAMSAQLLIPLAIDATPEHRRGHTIGVLMAGLLSGVLLARTVSGYVGDHFGWRTVFALAAAVMLTTGLVLQSVLPRHRPTLTIGYGQLMRSLWTLMCTQPALRRASLVSASSFAAFSAFWTVLSFLMHDRFHRGATEAGLFGVIGLAGALAAPLAGRLSDRRGPAVTLTIAMALSIAAFALMAAWVTIPGLIVGVLLLDLGVQSVQVAAQSEVMALVPEARSRLNTIYMVARFTGGALGSAAGAIAYTQGGWPATCAAGVGVLVLGTAVHFIGSRTSSSVASSTSLR